MGRRVRRREVRERDWRGGGICAVRKDRRAIFCREQYWSSGRRMIETDG